MPTICPHCSRPNPPEALFCFHDGRALGGSAARPPDAARRRFVHPFVFPSGRSSHTFDELALACVEDWSVAVELLRDGTLAAFLGSLGRADLSRAARAAARLDDDDIALDSFLRDLPGQAFAPPVLSAEPTQWNLGTLTVGQDLGLQLHLANQGMGVLQGRITSDSGWLSPGSSGASRLFQFLHETTVHVTLHGQLLRASIRPLEARLTIESNGGSAVVLVRAEVPLRSFPEGALAGASNPRELAEKARDNPREAAPLFENGAVARWYASNGWSYPVHGPAASGVAGVQQFFEAIGLAKAPRVEISESSVALAGVAGQALRHTVRVFTPEKKLVFAQAASDQPWLRAEVVLENRAANIVLNVDPVPDRPGDTLTAHLTVRANGRQRWRVPVRLSVADLPDAEPVEVEAVEPAEVLRARGEPHAPPPRRRPPPLPAQAALDDLPVIEEGEDEEEETPKKVRRRPQEAARPEKPAGQGAWALLPVFFLLIGLTVAFAHDLVGWALAPPSTPPADELIDPNPRLAIQFHDTEQGVRVAVGGAIKPGGAGHAGPSHEARWSPSMRFGLTTLGEGGVGSGKRLTFEKKGLTNNTCVRLDGGEWLFGERPFRTPDGKELGNWPGRWLERSGRPDLGRGRWVYDGRRSEWVYDQQKVHVTQTVGLIPGAQSGLLDTCLIHYRIDNKDSSSHDIGLRFLLDTFIGGNDGVPFLIPGSEHLCSTSLSFDRPELVPDFIQARESEDLAHPGTIAHIQLKLGAGIEPPGRVTLGAWPNPLLARIDPRCKQEKTLWTVPVQSIKTLPEPDSAVVLYWPERRLEPGGHREVGFTYGLGSVSAGEGGGKLALTVGGSFAPGGEFTVTAYVNNPPPGQRVTLHLPEGFHLLEGEAERSVPVPPPGAPSRVSPVSWKVRSGREGKYALRVDSSTGVSQTQPIQIKVRGLFGS